MIFLTSTTIALLFAYGVSASSVVLEKTNATSGFNKEYKINIQNAQGKTFGVVQTVSVKETYGVATALRYIEQPHTEQGIQTIGAHDKAFVQLQIQDQSGKNISPAVVDLFLKDTGVPGSSVKYTPEALNHINAQGTAIAQPATQTSSPSPDGNHQGHQNHNGSNNNNNNGQAANTTQTTKLAPAGPTGTAMADPLDTDAASPTAESTGSMEDVPDNSSKDASATPTESSPTDENSAGYLKISTIAMTLSAMIMFC